MESHSDDKVIGSRTQHNALFLKLEAGPLDQDSSVTLGRHVSEIALMSSLLSFTGPYRNKQRK